MDNLRGDQRALMAPDPSAHQGASAVLLLASEYIVVRFHKTLESITMLTIFFAKSFKPLATSMAAAAQLSVKAYSHTTIIQ